MTIETAYYFEPDDIVSVTFQCRNCKSKMSVPLSGIKAKPVRCHNCETSWTKEATWQDKALNEFLRNFGKMKTILEDVPFVMKFEVTSLKGSGDEQ